MNNPFPTAVDFKKEWEDTAPQSITKEEFIKFLESCMVFQREFLLDRTKDWKSMEHFMPGKLKIPDNKSSSPLFVCEPWNFCAPLGAPIEFIHLYNKIRDAYDRIYQKDKKKVLEGLENAKINRSPFFTLDWYVHPLIKENLIENGFQLKDNYPKVMVLWK